MAPMQLKHLNLVTPEVTALAAFFERFFGFKRLIDHTSGGFTLMRNDDDFILAVMKPKKRDPAIIRTCSMSASISTMWRR